MPVHHCTTIEISQFPSKTRSSRFRDTVEFCHDTITATQITPENKVINSITKLKSELACIPAPNEHNQIEDILTLRNLFSKCSKKLEAPNKNTEEVPTEHEEICNVYPRVPIIEEAPSPRAPELDATSKIYKHQEIKRLSDPKEFKISSLQVIKKTKEHLINSSPIATHTRFQVHFKPNPKSINTNISGRTR